MPRSTRPSWVTHTRPQQTKGETDVAARVRVANLMSYWKQKGVLRVKNCSVSKLF